jgi:hypothetical protein
MDRMFTRYPRSESTRARQNEVVAATENRVCQFEVRFTHQDSLRLWTAVRRQPNSAV